MGLLSVGSFPEASLDLCRLTKAMEQYYTAGTSPATQKSYLAGLKHYITFCSQAKLAPIPTTETTLLLFVTYLANQNLAYSTIRVYLTAIRSVHVTEGKHNTFESQLTPRLLLVMKGIRKLTDTSKPPRVRLPITSDILQGIHTVLSAEPHLYFSKMMWAACCMAFFGFLRSSEFTVPAQNHYDPEVHLSLSDITLDKRCFPTMVCVHIKQSKTDPFRQGAHIYLGRTYQTICPVKAIVSYLTVRGSKPGPIFTLQDGRKLTRSIFGAELDKILRKLDLQTHQYNTHSFRIGAATCAKQAGITDVHIKKLGRWKSDAYQHYIKTPPQQLANLSKLLLPKTLEHNAN